MSKIRVRKVLRWREAGEGIGAGMSCAEVERFWTCFVNDAMFSRQHTSNLSVESNRRVCTVLSNKYSGVR